MMKSAAEVEREVEASRSDLDRTVEALKEKMTPGQLFDEASRAMGSTGQQIASKFAEQAKENPLPLAVMGIGLAWLMTGSNKQQLQTQPTGSLEPRSFAPGNPGIGQPARDAKEHAGEVIADAKHKLGDAFSSMASAGQGAVHNVGAATQGAAHAATDFGRRTEQSFLTLLQREPLLIGGLAVVVGAAIGAALPSTEAEDRLVGEARDQVAERSKNAIQGGMEKAGKVAQAALETAKSEAKDVMMTKSAGSPEGGSAVQGNA